jgi:membrane glycosyltransferase
MIALHEPRLFGGRIALAASMLTETLISSLLAPIRMIFHTQFVCAAMLGRSIGWKSPLREDAETGWREALNWHGLQVLLGLAWGAIIYWLNPDFIWWWLPVVGALALSVPISVYSSRRGAGCLLRKLGLLLIPEEVDVPEELRRTRAIFHATPTLPGLADAVVDPGINALVCACGNSRDSTSGKIMAKRAALIEKAMKEGLAALDQSEKMMLLDDPIALSALHGRLRTSGAVNPMWRATTGKTTLPQIRANPPSATNEVTACA